MNDHDRLNVLWAAMGQCSKAEEAGDTTTLDSLLSIGYRHTDRLGKLWFGDEWLAQIKPRSQSPEAANSGHFAATLMGDLGIVTGIKRLHRPDAREDEAEPATAYTQLWIWRDGRWLRELFQATPIVETGAL